MFRGFILKIFSPKILLFLRTWITEQVQVEGDALLVTSAIQNASATYSGHYGICLRIQGSFCKSSNNGKLLLVEERRIRRLIALQGLVQLLITQSLGLKSILM
ncbi:hypothetical protein DVH24_017689 [Malus domestica]|uniref:Uncharacterized protein n=1 Tax=Malus domestica TaxID=3750 RepID=A0A498KE65_MALDO|nr:hypothetical protein DVH24_017689 [Malus domestica]